MAKEKKAKLTPEESRDADLQAFKDACDDVRKAAAGVGKGLKSAVEAAESAIKRWDDLDELDRREVLNYLSQSARNWARLAEGMVQDGEDIQYASRLLGRIK